jgi:hypothetical protein
VPSGSSPSIREWMSPACTTCCGTSTARSKSGSDRDSYLTVSALSDAERRFLEELNTRGVRYMIVGLSAAIIQGANTATRDIDLWFATIADPHIAPAAAAADGIWISGFGMMPAQLGGALGDRFDVVNLMSGLGQFDDEYAAAIIAQIDGVPVRVLPLTRILASKRAADRPKDRAVIPALEEALAAISDAVVLDDEA